MHVKVGMLRYVLHVPPKAFVRIVHNERRKFHSISALLRSCPCQIFRCHVGVQVPHPKRPLSHPCSCRFRAWTSSCRPCGVRVARFAFTSMVSGCFIQGALLRSSSPPGPSISLSNVPAKLASGHPIPECSSAPVVVLASPSVGPSGILPESGLLLLQYGSKACRYFRVVGCFHPRRLAALLRALLVQRHLQVCWMCCYQLTCRYPIPRTLPCFSIL